MSVSAKRRAAADPKFLERVMDNFNHRKDPKIEQRRKDNAARAVKTRRVRRKISKGARKVWANDTARKECYRARMTAIMKAAWIANNGTKPAHRPRKDDEAAQVVKLKDGNGHSWGKLTVIMNRDKPKDERMSKEAYRSLYRSRKKAMRHG